MGRLIYCAIGSLDGFIEDADGQFDWSAPDEQVHAHLNEQERSVSTVLYGRRVYEVMKVWETLGTEPDAPAVERDWGEVWRGQDKVVFSRTLTPADLDTERTRLARTFDPAEVRDVIDAAPGDVSIGGPELAAQALRAGLVDELRYYANPVIIGAGKPWLPAGLRMPLRLVDEVRFDSGVVHLAYAVERGPAGG